MKIEYDPDVDALYILLSDRKPDHVIDIPGAKFASVDVDEEGRLTGIEILFASNVVKGDLHKYAHKEKKTASSK
jgi:uncharacterized protein YuzE